jgi:hypothetical protein
MVRASRTKRKPICGFTCIKFRLYLSFLICTFFLDKKSTKKVKALPVRLPQFLRNDFGDYYFSCDTGGGTATGLRFRHVFGPLFFGWRFPIC